LSNLLLGFVNSIQHTYGIFLGSFSLIQNKILLLTLKILSVCITFWLPLLVYAFFFLLKLFLFPLQSGSDGRTIPGNTIAVQADMPFTGLTTFGGAFLSKFECSQMPHPVSFNCNTGTWRMHSFEKLKPSLFL